MNRKYDLLALDLDGTVYTDDKRITKKTMEALSRVSALGVRVVAATGRLFRDIAPEIRALPGFSYGIFCNGAGVRDAASGEDVFRDLMSYAEYGALEEELRHAGLIVDVFMPDRILRDLADREKVIRLKTLPSMRHFMLCSRDELEDLPGYLAKNQPGICKLTINFPEGDADRAKVPDILKAYPGVIGVTGGAGNLEITKRTTSKGIALERLAAQLEIPMARTVAFGDSGNDLEMIRRAGMGVAMGNGEAQVKQAADKVTKSNEEDGVAFALEELFPEAG